MKNVKKLTALLCVGTLSLSVLAGCGKEQKVEEKTSEAVSKEVSQTEEKESSSSENIEEVVGEPIEQLPISEEGITLKAAINAVPQVEDFATNEVTKYIEEQTGITLEFIELSPTDIATQVNAIMNGGDMPDIFIGYDFPYEVLCGYADAGLIQPLDEYVDKWGYNLKNTIMADPVLGEDVLAHVTYDDHVWAMPSGGALSTNVYLGGVAFVQYHFLEELGMDRPKTLDELRAFLEAVHEKYPDVIPMTSYENANWIFPVISQAFQFTDRNNYLRVSDGIVEFIGNNDLFLEALEYAKGMVDDGLIDPAAFTQDQNTLSTLLAQEGYNVAVTGCGSYVSNIMDTSGEEYLGMGIIGVLEGPHGYASAQVQTQNLKVRKALVVTSACEYPEEAFRLFDFFQSDDFAMICRVGAEGVQWEKAAQGTVGRDGEQAWFSLLTAQERVQPTTNVIYSGLENFFHSNIMDHCEMASDLGQKHVSAVEMVEQGVKEMDTKEYFPNVVMSAEDAKEFNELRELITKSVNSNVANFLLGNRDLTEFEDYCAELKAMGVERYVEMAQNAYDAMMK